MSLLNLQVWHFVLMNLCWDMLRPLQSLGTQFRDCSLIAEQRLETSLRLLGCSDFKRGLCDHFASPWDTMTIAMECLERPVVVPCLSSPTISKCIPAAKRPAAALTAVLRKMRRPKLCKAQDHWPDITWKPREKRKKSRLHWYMYSHSYILV